MSIKEFISECQKWDVFKKLSIYIVTSWLLIQVLGTTWESLGLPKVVNTYLLLVLLVGFPFYIFFVWKYQIAPYINQSVDDPDALDIDNTYKKRFQRIYLGALSIVSAVALLGVASIAKNNLSSAGSIPDFIEGDKIAVLKFDNNTGDPKYDIVGKMAADWMVHGITQYKAGQVVSPKIIEDYTEVLKASVFGSNIQNVMTEYIKPSIIINGDFYLKDGDLVMQCAINDGMMQETLISFNYAVCDVDNSLNCIEDLKQSALTYLIQGDSLEALNLQETPPKFDAYRYVLEAEEKYADQPNRYLELMNKAIEVDPDYFEPKVYKIAHYYNEGAFKTADSLLKNLSRSSRASQRQTNLLNMYRSLLNGNNRDAYKYLSEEYDYAPFHLSTNSTKMVFAQQYVNKPDEIAEIFNEIETEKFDLTKCAYCQYRYYIQALSLIELKRPEEAISLLEPLVTRTKDLRLLKNALLIAYVRNENLKGVDGLLQQMKIYDEHDNLLEGQLLVGRELILNNKPEEAKQYFERVLLDHNTHSEKLKLAQANYYLGNFEETVDIFAELNNSVDELDIPNLGLMAISQNQLNRTKEAEATLNNLKNRIGSYQYGAVDYALARYYAVTGDKQNSIFRLSRAVAAGAQFEPYSFQNDPHFLAYRDSEEFKNILTFWH